MQTATQNGTQVLTKTKSNRGRKPYTKRVVPSNEVLNEDHLATSKRMYEFITVQAEDGLKDDVFPLVRMLPLINGSLDELLDLRTNETMYFTNPVDENIKGIIKRME